VTTVTSGKGIFFDGTSSTRHDVSIELLPDALHIRSTDGRELAVWPYDQLEHLSSPDHLLRLGRRRNPALARLDVDNPALAAAIDEKAATIDRTGSTERRTRRKVVAWSIAATVSLVLVAVFAVPAIATRLAPLVPYPLEQKLGTAVNVEVRAMLDNRGLGTAFECGKADVEQPGRAALDKVIARLEQAAGLPIPLQITVVRRTEANAIALPGGHIYVFQGLIDKAEIADQLAGVIAHEIGHVAQRDSTRSVLQGAGLSFMFGMLLGDFVGGGAVVMATTTLLRSSYSREVEASADLYGVRLMLKIGADARALGTMLGRIAGEKSAGPKILLDHPEAPDRIAAINAMAPPATGGTLLDAEEWAALKRICAGR
jgi:Zn-dependent protease with chaperone function